MGVWFYGEHGGGDEFFSLPLFPQSSCAFESVGGANGNGSCTISCGSANNAARTSTCSSCGMTCASTCTICPRCGRTMTSSN